jgi:O-antigen ligase
MRSTTSSEIGARHARAADSAPLHALHAPASAPARSASRANAAPIASWHSAEREPRGGPSAAARPERTPLVLTLLGAFAVVLVSLPYKAFDLDRFFVPKELALHVTAAITGLLVLARRPRPTLARVDTFLVAFLAISVISALFAENWWLATRALAITASGFTMFWVARAIVASGLERPLLAGVATAIVVGAGTALLQAYGVEPEYMSLSRAPGGTFGNRNFMAHLSAIGLPVILFCAIEARRRWGFVLGTLGLALVVAALILSRSRAAWLALIVGGSVLAAGGWRMRDVLSDRVRRRRLATLGGAAVIGVAAALLVPNTLEWKSESPYLDSVKGVVNYREGSGAGRLVQYRNSFRMAAESPLLGVGPGNWAVEYPRFAARNDPSLNGEGMTSNPWPSSDWMAFLAERGFAAVAVLGLVFFSLIIGAWARASSSTAARDRLAGLTLGCTVVIAAIVGAFDAVLLLAVPALFLWTIAGALAPPARARFAVPAHTRGPIVGIAVTMAILVVLRASGQIGAMSVFTAATTNTAAARAALLDPGSYRLDIRLAEAFAARGDCRRVRQFAGAASELFPNAPEPKQLLRRCRR